MIKLQKLYKRCSAYSLGFYPFQLVGCGKNANVHYSACERWGCEVNAYSIKCGTSGSAPARPISLSCVITLLFIYPFVVVCKIHPAIAAAQIVYSCAAGANTSLRNTFFAFCFCGRVICVKQFISILIQTHNRNTYVMFTHMLASAAPTEIFYTVICAIAVSVVYLR